MNNYEIVIMSNGFGRTIIVTGYDVINAIQNNNIQVNEVISTQFVGTVEKEDNTQQPTVC